MLTTSERSALTNAVTAMAQSVLGNKRLSPGDVTDAFTPPLHRPFQTTAAAYSNVTALAIQTAPGRLYSVGVRAKIEDLETGDSLFKEFLFCYKREKSGSVSLTQKGSDSIGIEDSDDGSWSVDHAASGDQILVRVTGDATNTCDVEVWAWFSEISRENQ